MFTAVATDKMGGMSAPDRHEVRKARGAALEAWVEEIDLPIARLARHADIDRATIYAAFRGEASERSYDKLEAAREYITAHPHDEPEAPTEYIPATEAPGIVTIRMDGVFGAQSISFSGPADNIDEIKRLSLEFLREAREGTASSPEG